MPYYTYKGEKGKKLVRSLRQLVELTGMSERNLHRIFGGCDEYHNITGRYVIDKWELEKDGRKNNTNPNITR